MTSAWSYIHGHVADGCAWLEATERLELGYTGDDEDDGIVRE